MISISGISTKSTDGSAYKYRFRNENEVQQAVNEAMISRKLQKPIHTGARGCEGIDPTPTAVTDSMLQQQELFNKTSGIRIREEIVSISEDELHTAVNEKKQIADIADQFSDFYFYQGFQNVYGVYPYKDERGCGYDILYTINAVSYQNGAKYRRNAFEYQDESEKALKTVISSVTGKTISDKEYFDMTQLEYYP